MSLIKLQGNASGTGAFTIAAPNGNTDRTLTLPDATGTVNVSGLANEVPAGSAGAPAIYPTGDSNTGIFFPAADTIAFAEGGAEVARFDAFGNFLVGATSTTETGRVLVSGAKTLSSGIPTNQLVVADSTALASGVGGAINFVGTYTSGGLQTSFASIEASKDNGTSGAFGAAMVFKTRVNGGAQTERIRIDSNGNLLVGTTSGINGHTFKSSEGVSTYRTTVSAGFGIHHFYSDFGSTQSLRAYFTANGGLSNFSANNVNLSDERVKTDILPVGSYWDKVKALQVVTYKYRDQSDGEDNIGVIAQQVESVAPEFVCTSGFGETPEDGVPLKSIYETDMHYATLKALQEAMVRIETLEAEVAALKGASA